MRCWTIFSIWHTIFLLESIAALLTCVRDKSRGEKNVRQDWLKKSSKTVDKVHGFSIRLSVPKININCVSFDRSIEFNIKLYTTYFFFWSTFNVLLKLLPITITNQNTRNLYSLSCSIVGHDHAVYILILIIYNYC